MVFQSSKPEVLHIAKLNKYGGDLFYDQISKYLSPGNNLETNLPELNWWTVKNCKINVGNCRVLLSSISENQDDVGM